jgi:hypothetical protein
MLGEGGFAVRVGTRTNREEIAVMSFLRQHRIRACPVHLALVMFLSCMRPASGFFAALPLHGQLHRQHVASVTNGARCFSSRVPRFRSQSSWRPAILMSEGGGVSRQTTDGDVIFSKTSSINAGKVEVREFKDMGPTVTSALRTLWFENSPRVWQSAVRFE